MSRSLLTDGARLFGFQGDIVDLDLPNGRLSVSVMLDAAEDARRQREAIPPITDRRVVTALWELPAELEVPASAIPAWVVDRIHQLVPSAVRSTPAGYRRSVRRPVKISGVTAAGRNLPRLLERVGQLSAIAPMGVVVHNSLANSDPALLDAALYGVGIARASGDHLELLACPESVHPTPGPFLWWIAELAYEQLLENLTTAEPKR